MNREIAIYEMAKVMAKLVAMPDRPTGEELALAAWEALERMDPSPLRPAHDAPPY